MADLGTVGRRWCRPPAPDKIGTIRWTGCTSSRQSRRRSHYLPWPIIRLLPAPKKNWQPVKGQPDGGKTRYEKKPSRVEGRRRKLVTNRSASRRKVTTRAAVRPMALAQKDVATPTLPRRRGVVPPRPLHRSVSDQFLCELRLIYFKYQ